MLIFVYQPGCGGCEAQAPVVDAFDSVFSREVRIFKVDITRVSDLPWAVTMTPSFVLVRTGKPDKFADGETFENVEELARWVEVRGAEASVPAAPAPAPAPPATPT